MRAVIYVRDAELVKLALAAVNSGCNETARREL